MDWLHFDYIVLLMAREATIKGVLLWSTPVEAAREIYAALDAGLRNGTLLPVVASELPWPLPRTHIVE